MLCLACATASCGDAGARWQTVHDRSGDTIIVRTIGADSLASTIALREELTIGVTDGDDVYTFGEITLLAVAPDGTIYAYDRQAPVLRAYDADGRFMYNIGSPGSGPGEYRMAQGLAVSTNGELLLYDPANTRVNVYDSDGQPRGEWRFVSTVPPLILGAFVAQALTVDSVGHTYVTTSAAPPTADGAWRFVAVRHSPIGTVLDTIVPPEPAFERPLLVAEYGGRRSVTTPPYTPEGLWAITRSGALVSAFSAEYHITVTHPDGAVLRIEKEHPRVAVREEERKVRADDIAGRMRRTDPSWRWSGAGVPREKPVMRRLQPAEDGRLWVLLHQPSVQHQQPSPDGGVRVSFTEPAVYDIFESDGVYLGRVHVPERTALFVMRGSHAWGVARDSLDVQHIRRYRLNPAPVH